MGSISKEMKADTVMDDIYKFESNKKLLSFQFKDTGIPMWMFIRSPLIRATGHVEMGSNYVLLKRRPNMKKDKKLTDKYMRHNPFLTLRKDVVFAFFRYDQLSLHDDNRYYDDLVMPFMRLLPKRVTTIMSGRGTDMQENHCNHPNWKRDSIFGDFTGKKGTDFTDSVCDEDKENIQKLIDYIIVNYPMNIEKNAIRKMKATLYNVAANHRKLIGLCTLYLKIVRPKLVIISHGSYELLLNSAMIIACKRQHIITAEFQHAWVGKNHENFYYGDLIVKHKKCKKVLPDYLLTMGKYWNSQVHVPQKVFTIGYAKTINKSIVPHNNNILFAASYAYEQYESILRDILPCLDKDATIFFRLHPTEITPLLRQRFEGYSKYSNFILANEKDLNYYMQKCRYVIVDGSTVCYEALYTGRIVFNLDNDISRIYGINELDYVKVFKTAGDFLELWMERESYKAVEYNEFYDINWKDNFIKFLNMQGINIGRDENEIMSVWCRKYW